LIGHFTSWLSASRGQITSHPNTQATFFRGPRGVIFSSYSSLIAAAKTGEKRIDQIQRWLESNGVVIFDEAQLLV
jgi:hypothetical protein